MKIESMLSTLLMVCILMGCTTMKPMKSMKGAAPECPKCATMAQEMVKQAIALYDSIGKQAFERFHTDESFRDGELYVFVHRVDDGVRVSHSVDPSLVGGKTHTTVIDPDGINTGKFIREVATEAGNWINYRWEDPITKKALFKSSWVRVHDGYVFGCGVYKRMMACKHAKGSMAQDMANRAIALYDRMGPKAFEHYRTDRSFHDGELYIFVLQGDDSVIVAHGVDQEMIGIKATGLIDPDGVNIGKAILEGATEGGNWVRYKWEDPCNE